MSYEAKACAKINLHLEVLNKRQDGYHNIFSIMAEIGIFDLLKLSDLDVREDENGDIKVRIEPDGGTYRKVITGIPAGENLIARAAEAYLRRARRSGTVVFSVEKNIPAGAGMGGGSADAAAALKLLNRGLSALDRPELMELGASLGADIPFCVTGGIALCEGKGERVEPLASAFEPVVLIALSGIHVNTAGAYRELNRDSDTARGNEYILERKNSIRKGLLAGDMELLAGIFQNDFEEPVFKRHPVLAGIKRRLKEEGADIALMTGSGSAIVGLFRDKETAVRARDRLSGRIESVHVTALFPVTGGIC